MAAIAELAQSTVTLDEECDDWVDDSWAATASEVGALYLHGRFSGRLISEVTWRTRLVRTHGCWRCSMPRRPTKRCGGGRCGTCG